MNSKDLAYKSAQQELIHMFSPKCVEHVHMNVKPVMITINA
jgi:hypothetical protein